MLFRTVVFVLFAASVAAAQAPPEIIILNAKVRTMNAASPQAEAVALSGGKIAAVGSSDEVRKLAGPATRVIDANGRLLLPGFNDSHVHIMAVGNLFSSADLSSAVTEKDVADKLRHFARFLPKGRWILGSKLDPAITLSRSTVDAVTPENPVFIYHSDPKSALANSLALRQANVDSEDSFVRTATLAAVRAVVPKNHVRDWPAIAESAMNYAVTFGITSLQDTHSDDMAAIYRGLQSDGKLKTRIYDCVSLSSWAKLAVVGTKAADGNAMVRTGCVKGFYDPEDVETAALQKNIAGADSVGLQVLVHAIGKDANQAAIENFEKAVAANGPRDRRFRLEHAAGLSAELIQMVGRSKIIASMQPILFHKDGSGSDDYRGILDAGVPLALGADAPMRGFDPLEGIYNAVNAGGKRGITVDEAVYAYTLGSAYAEFQEKVKGSIEVGKFADLVLLSADITAEKADIRAAKAVLTVVNGRIVYENMN